MDPGPISSLCRYPISRAQDTVANPDRLATVSFGRDRGRMDELHPMLSRSNPKDPSDLNSR